MRKIIYILWGMCVIWIAVCGIHLVRSRQTQDYNISLCIPEKVYVEDDELSILAKNDICSNAAVTLEIVTSQDEVIIASVTLSPGQYMSSTPMLTMLESGEYICYVNVYDASNLEYISRTSLLVVKE